MFSSYDVRLHAISIENLKNVARGDICFTQSGEIKHSNILGIYGQNGSGKTTLIDALALFQYAAANISIPPEYAGHINNKAEYSKISYVFHISSNDADDCFTITYEMKLREEKDQDLNLQTSSRIIIFDEILSLARSGQEHNLRKGPVLDASSDILPFTPRTRFKALTGGGQKMAMELAFEKAGQQKLSRSFVFSPKLREIFLQRLMSESLDQTQKEEILMIASVLQRLYEYATTELFVVTNRANNMLGLDTLILGFRLEEHNKLSTGQLPILLRASVIPTAYISLIDSILEKINVVLQELIPGLTVRLKKLGKELTEDGQKGITVQLVSVRKDKEIPLKYESDGIKKIISVLSLFIALYNKRSITVAIDELDSGIFEYLLGELLGIIAQKGKGQLIFTCHNLRPLEILPPEFIAFTSTNPKERYVRLKKIKSSNNLRDVYYREIVVGDGWLYNRTRNPEISWALRKAWEIEA